MKGGLGGRHLNEVASMPQGAKLVLEMTTI